MWRGGRGERGTREIYFCLWQPPREPGRGAEARGGGGAASAPFAPPDLRALCAEQGAGEPEPSKERGSRRSATAATMSYQGKKNIPRITVSPAAASLPLAGPAARRAGRLGSLVRSPGRDGDPGLGGGERRSVPPARRAPPRRSDPGVWGKQNKEETQTLARRI